MKALAGRWCCARAASSYPVKSSLPFWAATWSLAVAGGEFSARVQRYWLRSLPTQRCFISYP